MSEPSPSAERILLVFYRQKIGFIQELFSDNEHYAVRSSKDTTASNLSLLIAQINIES